MALRVDELENLLGLLGVAGPMRGPKGPPGSSRAGMNSAGMESLLQSLLSDDDFMDDFATRRSAADVERLERAARAAGLREAKDRGDVRAKDAYRKGRRAGIKRTLGTGGKGLLGKAGRFGSLGKGLLYGAGALGTGLMALDLLMMLKGAASESGTGPQAARGRYNEDLMSMMQGGSGGLRSQLETSRLARDMSNLQDRDYAVEPSRELRNLMGSTDPSVLYRMRQQVNPSLREAYARAGLVA